MDAGVLAVVGGVRAAGGPVSALSDNAAAGLILGGGALGCGLLVFGLTMLAVRRSAREEQEERATQKVVAGAVGQRPGRARGRGARAGRVGAGVEAPHDPYPPQPYSTREPHTHKPYSRPYKVPRQEQHGSTNGHRPPDSTATGIPTTPYTPPDDEG